MMADTGSTIGQQADVPRGLAALEARLRRRPRSVAVVLSAMAHLAILIAIFAARPDPVPPELAPMIVQLVEITPPAPVLAPPAPSPAPSPAPTPKPAEAPKVAKAPEKSPPRKAIARRAPPSPAMEPLPTGEAEGADDGAVAAVELSEAEVSGAAKVGSSGGGGGAGSGAGGGACNMLEWLEQRLRRDPRVRAAASDAHRGKPLLLWNGDWLRHPGQDGGGLATVREAIMWEVAFAPEACRARPVQGHVVISLGDGSGSARIALGKGQWRWSDLLHGRRG